jgi:hypothetical protein
MAATELTSQQKADGRFVEEALRAKGVHIDAVFWIFDEDLRKWRFFIVSRTAEHGDPRVILREVRQAVKSANGSMSLKLFDTELKSPNSPEIVGLFAQLGVGGTMEDATILDFTRDQAHLSGIYVYYADVESILRDAKSANRELPPS